MINLLPTKEKENLAAEKIKKVMIILWLLIFFFILCLSCILFSIKVYLKEQVYAQETLLTSFKQNSEIERINAFKAESGKANQIIKRFADFYEGKFCFYCLIEEISDILPEGSRINDFLASSEGNQVVVSLSGFAPTREVLLSLKNNLESKNNFKDILFPSSNWVKSSDILFSVKFKAQ
ncbi:MAG: hypothetical protein A2365_02670 [Candidatus Nealsonbacteria bacterium RIFOXYB1_FULL_40_15]|uniref:PilN domain-containing protein n=2 Tax=Candidatus Nealsoniibacteriota TaxID=1817911 RepID=A0A1G2EQ54_9BACT|nr:MAG: hypothetical protein A2365_02670 [Candidatus Nealsonbacteria bacterium RIFOXYB1_FULL_40_15]OGZ27501.1 MAG: hypothetical protein A2427_01525 [Candidatus Nealsonbacteria bacterium RIFOXYC1_FULL_40_7]OGZ28157.1 MAG: hypothetical protein A2562_02930 [Candidatus Nealsonbacteria bacterium RIFOXYD1_FULL_39_11]